MVGLKKQFKHAKQKTKSITHKTSNTIERTTHPAYHAVQRTGDLAKEQGRRIGDVHDVLGIKGNYKKHYQWIHSTDGRKTALKQAWDMPLASERVAKHSFHAGDKDVNLTREFARYTTAGFAPEALVLNSVLNKVM